MRISVRPATERDADGIARVWTVGIEERGATFETEPRAATDVLDRMRTAASTHPTVVAVDETDQVRGAAWLTPYSPRAAYSSVAEFSVYLDPDVRGRGIGTVLMGALLQAAATAGVHKVTSRVFVENAASRALLARLGFSEVGIHRRHARLDGEWRDVVVVERLLDE